MFGIKKDKRRPVEKGQYLVTLTDANVFGMEELSRVSYWCDKSHLEHFAREILRQFTVSEIADILQEQALWLKRNDNYSREE